MVEFEQLDDALRGYTLPEGPLTIYKLLPLAFAKDLEASRSEDFRSLERQRGKVIRALLALVGSARCTNENSRIGQKYCGYAGCCEVCAAKADIATALYGDLSEWQQVHQYAVEELVYFEGEPLYCAATFLSLQEAGDAA